VSAAPIVFCSDFGLQDEFVGICHGVIARIAPEARVIDLTHSVPPEDVLRAALVLAAAVPFVPENAVFLAVVDPGVGSRRRGIAVRTESGRLLAGPDNGVLSLTWTALGGVSTAAEIVATEVVRSPVSPTFHGRDVFAPAAAHLALGRPLARLGPPVDPETLVTISVPVPAVASGEAGAVVLSADRFGNLQLALRPEDLEAAGLVDGAPIDVIAPVANADARLVRTFSDVPEGGLAVLIDSSGWVAVARNRGSAADTLGVSPGDRIVLRAPGSQGRPVSRPSALV
jgi:S-adenosylmethionine hydrolase